MYLSCLKKKKTHKNTKEEEKRKEKEEKNIKRDKKRKEKK